MNTIEQLLQREITTVDSIQDIKDERLMWLSEDDWSEAIISSFGKLSQQILEDYSAGFGVQFDGEWFAFYGIEGSIPYLDKMMYRVNRDDYQLKELEYKIYAFKDVNPFEFKTTNLLKFLEELANMRSIDVNGDEYNGYYIMISDHSARHPILAMEISPFDFVFACLAFYNLSDDDYYGVDDYLETVEYRLGYGDNWNDMLENEEWEQMREVYDILDEYKNQIS